MQEEQPNIIVGTGQPTPAQVQSSNMPQPNEPKHYQQPGSVSWTASEFIAHEKQPNWYGALIGVVALLTAIIYVLTRDVISSLVVIVGGVFFGVYAARQPRQISYIVDERGLKVGQRFYEFSQFRSFSVVPEGAFNSIIFMPHKRFAPYTTIYYAPESEDQIVDILSEELPYTEHNHDFVERLMRHIRF